MFKKPFLWLASIAVIFFLSLKIGNEAHTQLLNISDYIKGAFLSVSEKTTQYWAEYFNQVDEIRQLRERLATQEEIAIKNLALESENKFMRQALGAKEHLHANATFHLVRILSYAELGNYHRVWLEHSLEEMPEGKIFGLMSDNMVVGIALATKGRLLGILNGDSSSVYSVYIGKNKTPGIIKPQRGKQNIFANYILSWFSVHPGDDVYTSGLDNIFFEGIKVGNVLSVELSRGYLMAEVKPTADVHNLRYVWLIDTHQNEQINISKLSETHLDFSVKNSNKNTIKENQE